jgi:hypothetical protein
MNSHPPRVKIPVTGPDGLIAIVPHLLGFHPDHSLVITGAVGPGDRIILVLRFDLPDPPGQAAAADIAAHAVRVLRRQQITTAALIGYGPGRLVTPVIDRARQLFAGAGIRLVDALRVHDGRYWSYLCANLSCCRPDGQPVSAGHPAVAALEDSGLAAAASRDALAASIARVRGTEADVMKEGFAEAERAARRQLARFGPDAVDDAGRVVVKDAIDGYRRGGTMSSAGQFARLALALTRLPVRDDAWARMDPGHRDNHSRLWTDLARYAQPGYVAAPASLLAFVAWQSGHGALANLALDRVLDDDPDYSMAHLLRYAVDAGLPPSAAVLPMTPDEVAASYEARRQRR